MATKKQRNGLKIKLRKPVVLKIMILVGAFQNGARGCARYCNLLELLPQHSLHTFFSARACDDNLISQTNIMFVDH